MTRRPRTMRCYPRPPALRYAASLVGAILLIAALGAPPTHGQSYALRTTHAGAGHGPMTGGAFQLQGSAGQPATAIVGDGAPLYLGAGFWYAVRSAETQLPVELTAFTAQQDGETVRLAWTTASETNNAGFEVQRSLDGGWTPLGFVEGRGTTTEVQTYRFTDHDLPYAASGAMYRLRQVDTDGTSTVSEAVEVTRAAPTALRLQAPYPNPARSRATVRFTIPERAGEHAASRSGRGVRLVLYDLLGRQVQTMSAPPAPGRHELRLDTAHLASGMYLVRLMVGDQARTRRLTIVR